MKKTIIYLGLVIIGFIAGFLVNQFRTKTHELSTEEKILILQKELDNNKNDSITIDEQILTLQNQLKQAEINKLKTKSK